MGKRDGCGCETRTATKSPTETEAAAGSEDLGHRFARYLNAATTAPAQRKCRLEGFNLRGECEREGECKLEGEWLDIFYVYAVEFLEDIIWAAHRDEKAARRITKLIGVFEKKEQPPFLQRAVEGRWETRRALVCWLPLSGMRATAENNQIIMARVRGLYADCK